MTVPECSLSLVDCEFKHVGCKVRLPHKDMPAHLNEGIFNHMSLQIASYKQVVEENKQQLVRLEEENKQQVIKLTQDLQVVEENKQQLVRSGEEHLLLMQQVIKLTQVVEENKHQLVRLEKENKQLKRQVNEQTHDLKVQLLGTPICPVEFTMTNFEQHRKDNECWHSPPFYTQFKGYKMCMRICANGEGRGKNTHVSIFVHLMQGEFDDQVKWPFQGNVVIRLLNQERDKEYMQYLLPFDDNVPNEYTCRVKKSKSVKDGRQKIGWGYSQFICLTDLQN